MMLALAFIISTCHERKDVMIKSCSRCGLCYRCDRPEMWFGSSELQGVPQILCFLRKFLNIPDSGLSLLSLLVSVCTHNRQVENLRCSRTGRVQKNHKILRKKTQYLMNTLYILSPKDSPGRTREGPPSHSYSIWSSGKKKLIKCFLGALREENSIKKYFPFVTTKRQKEIHGRHSFGIYGVKGYYKRVFI